MDAKRTTVDLAGLTIDCRCHICGFFSSREEEYDVMLPFMKEGAARGDTEIHVLDKNEISERRSRLAEAGIDVEEAESSGDLTIFPWEEAYLKDDRFEQFAMLDFLSGLAGDAMQRASGQTRLWASMGWALTDFPGVNDLLEYESRLNEVLPAYDMVTICTYDTTKFSAPLLIDMIRTHPYVLIGRTLRENPFYTPPAQFLEELAARRTAGR